MNGPRRSDPATSYTALGAYLGICWGMTLGMVMENTPLWLSIGLMWGFSFGRVLAQSAGNRR